MLYMKCPTCKTLLGNKELEYEEKKKQIMNKDISDQEKKTQHEKLINSLGIPKLQYCCKQRLISYVDLIKIVK